MAETSKRVGEGSERNPSDARDQGRLHPVASATADATRQAADQGTETVKRFADTAADATRRTADAAAKAAHGAIDQGHEAALSGLRAIAGVEGPLTEVSLEQSRRTLEIASRVTDAYRQAAERASGDTRALFDSWMSLGRGLQHWQQAYFDAVRQSVESVAGKRQDLAQSNSPVRFAEVQRDLYVDLVSNTVRASTNLLQLAGQIVQDSARPLQERAQARA